MLIDFTITIFNAGDVLGRSRAAWSWERDAVKVLEEKAARLDAMIAASWKAHNERKEAKTNENWYKGIDSETLSYAMGYGRGNNFYCGD